MFAQFVACSKPLAWWWWCIFRLKNGILNQFSHSIANLMTEDDSLWWCNKSPFVAPHRIINSFQPPVFITHPLLDADSLICSGSASNIYLVLWWNLLVMAANPQCSRRTERSAAPCSCAGLVRLRYWCVRDGLNAELTFTTDWCVWNSN